MQANEWVTTGVNPHVAIVYLTCTTLLMRTIPSVGYVASLCLAVSKSVGYATITHTFRPIT